MVYALVQVVVFAVAFLSIIVLTLRSRDATIRKANTAHVGGHATHPSHMESTTVAWIMDWIAKKRKMRRGGVSFIKFVYMHAYLIPHCTGFCAMSFRWETRIHPHRM